MGNKKEEILDATEAVRRLKSDLVGHAHTGNASRLRGIVVSSKVWAALAEEAGFHGEIGITGREGSRVIRYSFYILENPSFPQQFSAEPYFFVGYPKEVYEERYLGKEAEILASEGRRSKQFQYAKFTELNPIAGVVLVEHGSGGHYYYDVDYDEMIAVAEKSIADGEGPTSRIGKTFGDHWRVTNPPQCQVNLNPRNYDYDQADIGSSVGSMFIQREPLDNGVVYQLVGIGRNGFGEIVDVVLGDSCKADPLEFAQFALNFFLSEEIEEFLSRHGVTLSADWKEGADFHETWGQWYDAEELGRLNEHRLHGSDDGVQREISATFISTRAKPYHFGFKEESVDNWEEFRSQHFPEDWKGWPETAQHRSIAAFAQTLVS